MSNLRLDDEETEAVTLAVWLEVFKEHAKRAQVTADVQSASDIADAAERCVIARIKAGPPGS